ncbi:hypothetical protein HG535_0F06220 [Zygotorulaspora mrakii]|uniref:Acid phosphatase n=1 Tax=Zygotorulaspora mrakii TaxID=42260 RepID=A0A7H9B6E7_ZYGMR|nr:uncharacterized protein HG535_0F06220 [Zygotorulaspora mrakii]QLG74110.1 hypothetical protein HG535_0F06220 [Zygotorulaspora mrakii]
MGIANILTGLASVAAISNAAAIKQHGFTDLEKIGTQEALFPFLGGSAPHFSYPFDYGIPKEIPDVCEMNQVQLFARHGERYPTVNSGRRILQTYYKLMNYTRDFNSSLSFLDADYEFFIQDQDNLEEETTMKNSLNPLNPYTGEMDAKRHGREFLDQYEELIADTPDFAVFTSNSKRCHDTAQFFIDALGNDYNVSLQVLDEDASSGANTLTPRHSCAKFNEDENEDYLATYSHDYLSNLSKRLNAENRGLNLTRSDASNLFNWCSYELNVRGYSYMCDVFTEEELIHYSYQDDLESYYENGNGNSLGATAGAVLFNASVELLKESRELDQKAWLSFTHDSDLINYIAAVGLFDDGNRLNTSSIPFRDHVSVNPGLYLKVREFIPNSFRAPTKLTSGMLSTML